MNTYRWAWALWWTPVAAFGVAMSVTSLPPTAAVLLAVFGAGIGLGTLRINTNRGDGYGASQKRNGFISAAARAGVCAYMLLGLSGLAAVIGGPTLLLGLLAVITSPCFIQRVISAREPAQAAPALPDERPLTLSTPIRETVGTHLPGSVQELSCEDLRRTWRTTYLPVKLAVDAASLDTLSALRRTCLDELERRDPTAFNAWLNSRPQASGTPETFLKKSGNLDRSAE